MSNIYPNEFLKKLNQYPHKTKYVRLNALDLQGRPIQRLEGISTGGSISISGKSKQQRTCNLTISVPEDNVIITDKYWALQHQFSVDIGLKNEIDDSYPDIIWFKQGTFMINSFSYSKSPNSLSVSISGKDKLSKLDGSLGGTLGATVVFDTIEEQQENGDWKISKIPIYDIIYNALRQYGNEQPYNIIIKDLENVGYELWEYAGADPLYIIIDENQRVLDFIFDGNAKVYISKTQKKALSKIDKYFILNPFYVNENNDATQIGTNSNDINKYVVKIVSGQAVGYHETELIYPGDLILGEKDTVVTLLDKIISMLGPQPFEYFYDIDGRFVLQKQQYFLKDVIVTDEAQLQAEPMMLVPDYFYKFEDLSMFTQMGVNPNINNIKNDYILYGEREGVNGGKIINHIRYVIEKKPVHDYKSLPWKSLSGKQYPSVTYTRDDYDWREILYRMAQDFYRHQGDIGFYQKLEQYNPWAINGITGYEQYYIDIFSFWRDLYNPESSDIAKYFPKGHENQYWNRYVKEDPTRLNFWFDFLDTEGEWENISVSKIGQRPYVEKSTFKTIHNTQVPELQFVLEGETPKTENAYAKINLPSIYEEFFRMSAQTNSGLTLLSSSLNNYTNQVDTLSITMIPIYYMEPNSRIYIEGYGDYLVNSVSYSLTANATMSLQLSKLTEQFIKEVV